MHFLLVNHPLCYRLKWVAHLEFSHNKETSDLSWDSVERRLPRTDKLRAMVREGIPHSLRPQLWMRFSGKCSFFIEVSTFFIIINSYTH